MQKVRKLVLNKKKPVLLMLLSICILGAAVGFYHLTEKNITIVDTKDKINISTRSKTVEQVLEENEISLEPKDVVEPSLETKIEDGSEIVIKRAATIKIFVEGKEQEIRTATRKVEEIIKEAKIDLGSKDKVTPERKEEIEEGKKITIVRVEEKVITQEEKLDFAIQKNPNKQMEKGKNKVIQRGKKGLKKNEIKITYEDGEEVKRETLKEEVVIEPTDEVIQVGMSNTVNTSRGATRFDRSMVVTATAYSPSDPGVNNKTSVGAQLKRGVVAVDPRIIPYYTRLYIPGYGFGKALDTGGAIKGNRIDLAMGSRSEALKYGRRKVKIYLLGK